MTKNSSVLAGLLVDDSQRELPPDQREAAAHLHQERLDVVEQSQLELPLLRPLSQAEELEVVGVLYRVANELGVGLRQRVLEAGERAALAPTEITHDLSLQNVARPAVLNCFVRVPKPRIAVIELRQQCDVLSPG